MDTNVLEKIRNRCGFSDGFCLSSNGNSSGVDLWWNDLDVFVLSFPSHHIHAIMLDEHKNLSWHDVGIFNWLETSNTHLA